MYSKDFPAKIRNHQIPARLRIYLSLSQLRDGHEFYEECAC